MIMILSSLFTYVFVWEWLSFKSTIISTSLEWDIIEVYGDGKSLKFNSDFTNFNAVER